MKKVKFFSLIVFCLSVLSLYAQKTVSVEDAQKVAMTVAQSFKTNGAAGAMRSAGAPTLDLVYTAAKSGSGTGMRSAAPGDEVYYYIFNVNQNQGFVIVSGNDIATPVLGYSDEGGWNNDNLPPNLKWWMSQYQEQIKSALIQSLKQDERTKKSWSDYKAGIAPTTEPTMRAATGYNPGDYLVKTNWDQNAPYNNMTPTINNQHSLTGCVATAMAQIIYYWSKQLKYDLPLTGTIPGYTKFWQYLMSLKNINGYNGWTVPLSTQRTINNPEVSVQEIKDITLPGTHLNEWFLSPNYNSSYIDGKLLNFIVPDSNNVSKLMYYCGASVGMNYKTDVSKAYSGNVLYALPKYFGFDPNITYYGKNATSLIIQGTDYNYKGDWNALLRKEIDSIRPVFYGGDDVNGQGGHLWICDGYKTPDNINYTFHMNWGWSGYGNTSANSFGWFSLTALNPDVSEKFKFNNNTYAIVNIKPASTILQTRSDYCKPQNANTNNIRIKSVNIDKSIFTSSSTLGFEDLTDRCFIINGYYPQHVIQITIEGSGVTSNTKIGYAAYIDFNQNGQFEESEKIWSVNNQSGSVQTALIKLPDNCIYNENTGRGGTIAPEMRMRIIATTDQNGIVQNSCNITNGQAKDFLVYIAKVNNLKYANEYYPNLNDTPETAINSGNVTSNNISTRMGGYWILNYPGDIDYYKFYITNYQDIMIKIGEQSNINLNNINIEINDSLGSKINKTKEYIEDSTKIIVARALPAGTYYVKLSGKTFFDFQKDSCKTISGIVYSPSGPTVVLNQPAQADITSNSVRLSWDKPNVPIVTGYNVWKITYSSNGLINETKINSSPISDLYYTVTNLTASTNYSFAVAPIYNIKEIIPALSNIISITTSSLIAPPTNLIGGYNAGANMVYLSWTASAGATGYDIYKGGLFLGSSNGTATTYNEISTQNLVTGNTYVYTVKAKNASGSSAASTPFSIRLPNAPRVDSIVGNAAYIKWDAVPGVTQYSIYNDKFPANQTQGKITLPSANTKYTVYVAANVAPGIWIDSKSTPITTGPAVPTNLQTSVNTDLLPLFGGGNVVFSCSPSAGAIRYEYRWKLHSSSTYLPPPKTTIDTTVYSNLSILASMLAVNENNNYSPGLYDWQVRAKNASGSASDWSPAGNFTILPAPVVSDPVITATNVTLKWQPVSGATGYEIQYGTIINNSFSALSDLFSSYSAKLDAGTATSKTINLAQGNYKWRVIAKGTNAISLWSGGTFTINVLKSATDVTAIDNVDGAKEVSLYPNPVSDILTVTGLDNSGETVNAIVYDMTGSVVKTVSVKAEGTIRINVSDLPKNSYILSIEGEKLRFIKN